MLPGVLLGLFGSVAAFATLVPLGVLQPCPPPAQSGRALLVVLRAVVPGNRLRQRRRRQGIVNPVASSIRTTHLNPEVADGPVGKGDCQEHVGGPLRSYHGAAAETDTFPDTTGASLLPGPGSLPTRRNWPRSPIDRRLSCPQRIRKVTEHIGVFGPYATAQARGVTARSRRRPSHTSPWPATTHRPCAWRRRG